MLSNKTYELIEKFEIAVIAVIAVIESKYGGSRDNVIHARPDELKSWIEKLEQIVTDWNKLL